jgi:predicted nucleic acid-binding protein
MDEKLIICDTDVLIDYFDTSKPRHQPTKHILEQQITLDKIVISAITKMELFLGVANKM